VTSFAANGGLVGGALGISLGLAGLYGKASQGEALQPLPWNDDGIQTRVDGLAHNYIARTLDLSVWTGVAVAAALYASAKSPLKLSLMQTLSLGSVLGSLTGIAFIGVTENRIQKALDADDEE
jgi:hypothetical protein